MLTNVYVDDQAKALVFYTDVLGFVKKKDIPLGESRWLTVVSPDDPDGAELFPRARWPPRRWAVQGSAGERRNPFHIVRGRGCACGVGAPEGAGVRFTHAPARMGSVTMAVFDDSCGNLIQIADAGGAS